MNVVTLFHRFVKNETGYNNGENRNEDCENTDLIKVHIWFGHACPSNNLSCK